MKGAHLEYIAPYHWRLTGDFIVDIKRTEIFRDDLTLISRWIVKSNDPERAGGDGNWSGAAEALAHAYSLATHDVFDTERDKRPADLPLAASGTS